MTQDILKHILLDILVEFRWLPAAFVLGGGYACLCKLVFFSHGQNEFSNRRIIYSWLLGTYFCMVPFIAFFSREPGSRTTVELHILGTWGSSAMSRAYVIENILFFVPFGLFFADWWHKCICRRSNFIVAVLISACTSILLESLQYVTGRGYFQVDDILMNMLGGIIGYLLYVVEMRMHNKKNRVCGKDKQ